MIRKVGIVGCGPMGTGITQVILEAGYVVIPREIDASLLDKGPPVVKKGLERSVEKATLSSSSVFILRERARIK